MGLPLELPGVSQSVVHGANTAASIFLLGLPVKKTGTRVGEPHWSLDPKEDWALITWFTYAAYLHTRMLKGWRGRRSAYFAIIGFGVVLFTFFGVSYLLSGLHSYA